MMLDGAILKRIPLIRVVGGVPNELPVLFGIEDRTEHMQQGGMDISVFSIRLHSSHEDLARSPLHLN